MAFAIHVLKPVQGRIYSVRYKNRLTVVIWLTVIILGELRSTMIISYQACFRSWDSLGLCVNKQWLLHSNYHGPGLAKYHV